MPTVPTRISPAITDSCGGGLLTRALTAKARKQRADCESAGQEIPATMRYGQLGLINHPLSKLSKRGRLFSVMGFVEGDFLLTQVVAALD